MDHPPSCDCKCLLPLWGPNWFNKNLVHCISYCSEKTKILYELLILKKKSTVFLVTFTNFIISYDYCTNLNHLCHYMYWYINSILLYKKCKFSKTPWFQPSFFFLYKFIKLEKFFTQSQKR